MALLSLRKDFQLPLVCSECTALVLLDLSAAFDNTDHHTLLGYLKASVNTIKIGLTLSDLHKFIYGVLQGSVPGTLQFSIYSFTK